MDILSLEFARKNGLSRYYTGKVCIYGHLSERMVSNRRCIKCLRIEKELWNSSNSKHRSNVKKQWDTKNKEIIKEKRKRDYTENRDKYLQKGRKWRAENPDKMAASQRNWRTKNDGRHKHLTKLWRNKHPEAVKVHRRNRRARIKSVGGCHTESDILELLSKQNYLCANPVCRKDLHNHRHADHIMPISLGGSNDISNIQMLCPACNHKKHNKHPDVWNKEIGMLC